MQERMPDEILPPVDGDSDVHLKRAQRALPGPIYYYALRWIHAALAPRTYVEIGVRRGDSLRQASPETLLVGIDPQPMLRPKVAENPQLRLFKLTSDEFFARHDLRTTLGGRPPDLAFIDGLHLFEQVLLDFINIEAAAVPESVILLHDCIPLDATTAARQRTTTFYSGDVWKAILAIREWRPDLAMTIVPASPTGLCIVTRCDPASRTLRDNFDACVQAYGRLSFDDYLMRVRQFPPRISNTRASVWDCIRRSRVAVMS